MALVDAGLHLAGKRNDVSPLRKGPCSEPIVDADSETVFAVGRSTAAATPSHLVVADSGIGLGAVDSASSLEAASSLKVSAVGGGGRKGAFAAEDDKESEVFQVGNGVDGQGCVEEESGGRELHTW